ncbi:MAG: PQQ-like beta-propeller repeat protein, partial [Planctomycetes bacterium]|nr:PQQ-like beta-propeller repeat protein [Planctomycetota bacterium]
MRFLLISIIIITCTAAYLWYTSSSPQVEPKQHIGQHSSKELTTNKNWTIFRNNQALTGRVAADFPPRLIPQWTYQCKGDIQSSPIIAENIIFIGCENENLYALDLFTGQNVWQFESDDMISAPPLYLSANIIFGSESGSLYSLEAKSGKTNWVQRFDSKISGGVNYNTINYKNYLYFGSYDNKLYCINEDDGAIYWSYETENYLNGTPAISNGLVSIGGCDQFMRAIDAISGVEKHAVELGSYIAGSAAIENSIAYIG